MHPSWVGILWKQVESMPYLDPCSSSSCPSLFSSVVSMSTLYVLSLRSEEDLVDIDGWVFREWLGGMRSPQRGWSTETGITEHNSRAAKPAKHSCLTAVQLFGARSEEWRRKRECPVRMCRMFLGCLQLD